MTEDSVLTSAFNALDDGLQLAGFQVTPTGRFWVTPEAMTFFFISRRYTLKSFPLRLIRREASTSGL